MFIENSFMKKSMFSNEGHILWERVDFQGKEQPCHQMFQSGLNNQKLNLKKQKGEEIYE